MAFYQDKEQRGMLLDKIIRLLTTAPTGSTEAYWKQVQSGTYQNEGYILYSKGKSGLENLYVRFVPSALQNALQMSMLEGYTPNPVAGLNGTIVNESHTQYIFYASNTTNNSGSNYNDGNMTYVTTYPVHYILSFDKDKIMLVLKGDPSVTASIQTLAWIGMPQRLSDEKDSTAMAFAVSGLAYRLTNASVSQAGALAQCKVLKDRTKAIQATYTMIGLNKFKTKGWDNNLLLSNVFLQGPSVEGVRSMMEGIHPISHPAAAPDFRNGDEIMVGTKRYTVLLVTGRGSGHDVNCFPSDWMAIEQLS